ncbi:MAG: hypothetical protein JSU04_15310 [Bdellovibrionales bacterium]|nr:hypothetical protein [Bdellovibrionales bacterium]
MNRRGFTVIDFMLACALAGISGLALMSFGQLVSEYTRKANVKFGVSDVRSEIMMITMDPKAWGLNISKAASSADAGGTYNPEMACLKDKTNCNEGEYPLSLFDGSGRVLVDALNPNQGFTSKGSQCFTYGATDGSEGDCIFRYQMRWEAVCPPAQTSCKNPQVHLKLNLLTSTQQQSTYMNMRTTQVAMGMDMIAVDPIEMSSMSTPPPATPPADPSLVSYTNSTLYSTSNTIVIDLSAFVEDATGVTFSLAAPKSSENGTVILSGSSVTYTPAAGFYGHDTFPFVATDALGGVKLLNAKVEVMTPHSWTGQAGDKDASNPLNWCGVVVAGQCDHASFGSGLLNSDAHVVFDDTCLAGNCDANFPQSTITIRRYEQKATYKSTVTMNCSALNVNSLSSGSYALSNKISNSGDNVADLDIQGGSFKAVGSCKATVYGCTHIGSGVTSTDLPAMNIFTDKNPLGAAPAAGSCTGFKAEATKEQLPSFASNPIVLTPVNESKPELYLDKSLDLANFKTGTCVNTYSTCSVYYTSDLDPATTSASNAVNGNFSSSIFAGHCKNFFDQASSLVLDATNDVNKSGFAGTFTVPAARNVAVSGGAGTLYIRSAIKVTSVSGIAGDTAINAGSVDGIGGMAGTLCIKTGVLGDITGTAGEFNISATTVGNLKGGAGTLRLRAYSIKSIQGAGPMDVTAKTLGALSGAGTMEMRVGAIDTITGAMTLNLYGTVVNSLDNFAGDVCLYNGAKILNVGSYAGTIKDCGTAP